MSFLENDDWQENDLNPVYASHTEVTPVTYSCPYCGEGNETLVDLSGGYLQEFVEDCAICCSPILLTIRIDESSLEISIEAVPE